MRYTKERPTGHWKMRNQHPRQNFGAKQRFTWEQPYVEKSFLGPFFHSHNLNISSRETAHPITLEPMEVNHFLGQLLCLSTKNKIISTVRRNHQSNLSSQHIIKRWTKYQWIWLTNTLLRMTQAPLRIAMTQLQSKHQTASSSHHFHPNQCSLRSQKTQEGSSRHPLHFGNSRFHSAYSNAWQRRQIQLPLNSFPNIRLWMVNHLIPLFALFTFTLCFPSL